MQIKQKSKFLKTSFQFLTLIQPSRVLSPPLSLCCWYDYYTILIYLILTPPGGSWYKVVKFKFPELTSADCVFSPTPFPPTFLLAI